MKALIQMAATPPPEKAWKDPLGKLGELKLIINLRLAIIRPKHFFGDYATNIMEARKFKAEHDIITMYIEDSRIPFVFVRPTDSKDAPGDLLRAALREQVREHSRKLRKKHQLTIWYVPDNQITRLLGFRPGKEDKQLR